MANLGLKSITFPNNLTYTIPEVDNTLSIEGAAAEVVAVKEALEGKAPAGYGLGVSTPQITLTDCNDGGYTGWYVTTMNTTNSPLETGGWLRADMFNESYGAQTWYNDRYNGIVAQRFKISGVWQPWEWVNPPMEVGVEYRTTERCNGKVVYVRRLNGGLAANGKLVFLPETVDLQRVHGKIGENPFSYDDGHDYAKLSMGPSAYKITCSDAFVGQQVYIQYWYTK